MRLLTKTRVWVIMIVSTTSASFFSIRWSEDIEYRTRGYCSEAVQVASTFGVQNSGWAWRCEDSVHMQLSQPHCIKKKI